MNFIDIVVGVVLVYGIIQGFRKGVIKEVLGLIGLVVAIWAGFRLAFVFADYYKENFELPANIVPFLAFITAFLLAILLVYLLGRMLTNAAEVVQLSFINKLAGAAFGVLKWGLIVGALLTLSMTSEMIPPQTKEESATYPILKNYTEKVNEYTVALIPAARNVFTDMDNYFQELDSIRKAKKGSDSQTPSEPGPKTPSEPRPGTQFPAK